MMKLYLWTDDDEDEMLASVQVTLPVGATISEYNLMSAHKLGKAFTHELGSRYDHGINMVFSDRAEEFIRHPAHVQSRGAGEQGRQKPAKEKPDRLIGLTETENFRLLLNSHDNRTPLGEGWKKIRDTVDFTFKDELKPLLFPFLIIEAKSGQSGFDFQAIAAQTIYCIEDILRMQLNLRTASEKETFQPLAWFIGYAGQFWHISACYMHVTRSTEIEFVCAFFPPISRRPVNTA